MIKDSLKEVGERIAAACLKVSRSPNSITVVCVSKGRTVEQIKEAVEAGITDIGENRTQEAVLKYQNLLLNTYNLPLTKLHMVGHLQTNKAKDAVKIFTLIQSVDSVHLAQVIDKEAFRINKVQDILIEVKTSPEATKFGLRPDEVMPVIKDISEYKNINIKGLMTIAPLVDDSENARPYFKMLRKLRDKIDKRLILSMGMSGDFEAAIEEGADMIRLGRAIFA